MKKVGDYLASYALSCHKISGDDFDLFARSAYNRYYYAVFLSVKRMLVKIRGSDFEIAHADAPCYVRGAVRDSILRELKKRRRGLLVSDSRFFELKSLLHRSSERVAKLLDDSRPVRVAADYRPEIKITYENNTISLISCKQSVASSWVDQANMHCSEILMVWRDCGEVEIQS